MRYAISYVSTASKLLTRTQVEELLRKSEESNNRENITGLLLYSDGNFFQVIEGEEAKIKKLYNTIKKDERHSNIIKILSTSIHKESYDGYKSDLVTESVKFDRSKFQTYAHYVEVLDKPKQEAVKNILQALMQ
ncbi:MAG: BLUF domain-containing protein [Christiangramia sp.]|nr:BLUF domain-containing protein [Christiangramia sp.]